MVKFLAQSSIGSCTRVFLGLDASRREAGIVKCSVLRRLISLVSVDFKHCASYGLAFVNFLNFDRPEQLRRCFPQYARTCIPGCQRPVMVDAVPAQYKRTLLHGRVSMAFPAPMRLPRLGDLSDSKRRCQDQERSAPLYVACGTPFSDYLSFVIIHLGVSYKTG